MDVVIHIIVTIVVIGVPTIIWGSIWGGLAASLAPRRNYRRSDWFILGFLFGPLATISLFASGKGEPSAAQPRWSWDPGPRGA